MVGLLRGMRKLGDDEYVHYLMVIILIVEVVSQAYL